MPRKPRAFKFVEAPPERSMRRKAPDSAPRLYEWLVDNGYVEPVSTGGRRGKKSAAKKGRRITGSKGSSYIKKGTAGAGRLSSGTRKKKKRKQRPF